MAENDPKYSGQNLTAGSADAARIYNEMKLRVYAAHGLVRSMTETDPPSSPAVGDAYLVASVATGVWDSHEGEIAIYANGWIFMETKPGMSFLVQDTGARVSITPAGVITALDGRQTITTTGAGNITWDCSKGLELEINLEHDSTLLKPINMTPGRLLSLIINQSTTASNTLVYETGQWYSSNGQIVVTAAANSVDHYFFMGGSGLAAPIEVSRNLNLQLVP